MYLDNLEATPGYWPDDPCCLHFLLSSLINDIRSAAVTNIFVSALVSPANNKTPEKISCVVPDQLGAQIRAGGDPNNRDHPRQPSKSYALTR